MPAILTTPPTAEVVTAAEARTMLGLGASDPSDELLEAMIGAVVGTLDAASGGWLGRALAEQEWELRLDGFPSREIVLPYPPLISVEDLAYDDGDGVERTLVEDTDFRVVAGTGGKASVAPVYGRAWPSARCDEGSVRIRFIAGYPDGEVPAAIKAAIVLGVRQLMSTSTKDLHLARDEVPGVLVQQFVV
ncbi:MAG: hypothetical protein J0H08_08655, partial [Rhizobiales bacterium]|nr:hypothetical protein [Hyphomicrobiales bacterium]